MKQFLLCFFLCIIADALFSQKAEVIDYRQKPKAISILIEKDETLTDNDVFDMHVTEKEIYLFYSVGSKLFLRYSPNKGATWQEELVGYYQNKASRNTPLQVIKGKNGYLHLFYVELAEGTKKLLHLIRTDPSLDWFTQTVTEVQNNTSTQIALAAQEDCNGILYLAYTFGDGEIYQAEYERLKWKVLSFKLPVKHVGVAITAGFDRKIHLAIAENKGKLYVATRYLQEDKFQIDQIGESGDALCSISLTDDGGLFVASTAFVSGRNVPLQISKMDKFGSWKNQLLANSDSANFTLGNSKNLTHTIDESGRLHLVAYLTDYNTESNKSLCYLFSNDRGKSWFAQTLKTGVYGYPQNTVPIVDFNQTEVFVAYKNMNRQLGLLQYAGVDLRGIPACLPRKNEKHVDQVIVQNNTSRIVQTPAEVPLPKAIPNVTARPTKTQAEFITSSKFLKLIVWDNKEVDGDTISVFLNNQCVLHYYGLQSKKHVVGIELDPTKEHQLVLYAESEGSRPPCTASIALRDDKRKQDFVIKSSLKENGAIKIRPSK